jgi:hypothetical protein
MTKEKSGLWRRVIGEPLVSQEAWEQGAGSKGEDLAPPAPCPLPLCLFGERVSRLEPSGVCTCLKPLHPPKANSLIA